MYLMNKDLRGSKIKIDVERKEQNGGKERRGNPVTAAEIRRTSRAGPQVSPVSSARFTRLSEKNKRETYNSREVKHGSFIARKLTVE